MSGETEQTAENEAAEATETGQETAPSENAEAADEFETEWASMVAAETGETEAAEEDPDDDPPSSAEAADADDDDPPASAEEADAGEGGTSASAEAAGEGGDAAAAATGGGDAPAGAPDAADIWAEATEEQRSAFTAERERAEKAERDKKATDGHASRLQRRLNEHLAASGESSETAADPSQEAESEPVVSEEARAELAEFEAEFPDIAKPILKHVIEPLSALVKTQAQRITNLEAGLKTVGEDRMDAAIAEQEQIVRADHEDYDDIADTDDFVEWAKSQPEFIRVGIMANAEDIVDGAAVSKILTMYKADKGIANGHANGHVNGNGAAAGADPAGAEENAGDAPPAGRKPAADPTRSAQLRAARGNPAPSPGAPAREDDGTRSETEESVWAELRREEERRLAAEPRA